MGTNVMFKRGSQTALNNYLSTGSQDAVEGAFYLTSDTNRLYIGKKLDSGKIRAVPVNQGVISVASINNLPNGSAVEPGQFYYINDTNILCVYSGSGGGWVQINSDTNTSNAERAISATASNNIATVTDIIYQTKINGDSDGYLSKEYQFTGKEGFGVTVEQLYSIPNSYSDNVVYYSRSGAGTSASPYVYTDVSTKGINVDSSNFKTYYVKSGYNLILTPTIYQIKSTKNADNNVSLTLGDGQHSSSVQVIGGDNVTITADKSNEIKITTANANMGEGASAVATSFDKDGLLSVTVTDSEGGQKTGSVTPVITLGDHTESIKFAGGTANLPVYTKSEIDALQKEFNAMVYRGTVSDFSKISTKTDLKVGDTYKAAASLTIPPKQSSTGSQIDIAVGDLIIATGDEDSSGHITSSSLKFDYVPSGDDTAIDTTYEIKAITHGAAMYERGQTTATGGLKLDTDAYLTLSDDTTKDITNIVKVSHNVQAGIDSTKTTAQVAATKSEKEEAEKTWVNPSGTEDRDLQALEIDVPVLSMDAAGHITKVANRVYKVTDTHATVSNDHIKAVEVSSTGNNASTANLSSSAKIETQITVDGTIKQQSFAMKSSTLAMAADSDGNLSVNMEWGAF